MSPSSQPQHPSEDQDAYVLEKREKARERQRRKRARDKSASVLALFLESHPNVHSDPEERETAMQAKGIDKRLGNGRGVDLNSLPPGEAARREKIRIAARERQRRHRASVKAKRMAELGMAIVNAGGGVEQKAVGYTINENGQYEAVLADTSENLPPLPAPYSVSHPHATPGQTFSSTLLLALSCAPLLKQHLLRTLRSSNEELAAFEPIIAAAFDHWDHSRALYYAAHEHPATPSSYLPLNAPHSPQYDNRDRSYRPFPPTPSLSKPQDVDESMSASDESHDPDEHDQRSQWKQTEPLQVGMQAQKIRKEQAEEREKEERQRKKVEGQGPDEDPEK